MPTTTSRCPGVSFTCIIGCGSVQAQARKSTCTAPRAPKCGSGRVNGGCKTRWGLKELRGFLAQGDQVRSERKPRTVTRLWLFAYSGLTPKAEAFAREHGILVVIQSRTQRIAAPPRNCENFRHYNRTGLRHSLMEVCGRVLKSMSFSVLVAGEVFGG